jgi:hypothetical protein
MARAVTLQTDGQPFAQTPFQAGKRTLVPYTQQDRVRTPTQRNFEPRGGKGGRANSSVNEGVTKRRIVFQLEGELLDCAETGYRAHGCSANF